MALAVLASAAAYYVGLFFYLDRSIERVNALAVDAPGIISPAAQDASDNFLIVGTATIASRDQVASAMLAHLSPQGDRAVLVSLPLTAFVDVPACPQPAQDQGGGLVLGDPYGGSLASSYVTAGAGCLVRAVQQLSGMRVDHYVQLDLESLPGMVDALGGVPVCLPVEVPTGGSSTAPAGWSVLDATQVRAILGADDDDDPTGQVATDRQRVLLASTLREALRVENLANPIAVTGFVGAAAEALTLDPGTTLGELKDLGDKLGEFTVGDTVQTGVPLDQVSYRPAGSQEDYALIDQAASRAMFQAIISDTNLPDLPDVFDASSDAADAAQPGSTGEAEPGAGQPTADPTSPQQPAPDALTVAPQNIAVNVFNGIGTPGLASQAAEALIAQGFVIGQVENQITDGRETVVRYTADQLDAARTVAASVPGSILREGPTVDGFIDLILGSTYSTVVPVVVSPSIPSATVPTPTAEAEPTATLPIGPDAAAVVLSPCG